MSDFLRQYRTQLKIAATQNLEKTVNKVFHIISDGSKLKNDIILLRARYQSLEQDIIKGIVSEPDRVLRTNRILDSLFNLADNIQVTDLQESEDEALNQFLNDQAKVKPPVAKEPPLSTDATSSVSKASSDTFSELSRSIPIESDIPVDETSKLSPTERPVKSITDLDIFTEGHRNPLSFFPVIYRDIRSQIIKNPKPSPAIGQLILSLEEQLPALQQFKNQVELLDPVIKKIRIDHKNRVYWMQFQQISNLRTTLSLESLEMIGGMNEKVDEFAQQLKEKGFLK